MIDDMTSSDRSLNEGFFYSCLACHSKTKLPTTLEEEFDCETRLNFLKVRIEARRGDRRRPYSRISAGYVMEEAAKRHFQLMEVNMASLRGKFDGVDFEFLLNTNCSPVWRVDHYIDLPECVLDNLGIYASTSDEIDDENLRSLIDKLRGLSPTEQLAVIEACELVWRGYKNPLL
ncbi:hypothetical protein AVKW3434_13220 [Acidovorax sp. SUPP3434]|uniref:hypothetical protein n=1 Tax=Acidovorax sp. SUPP3434 TaxID=2920880 RepID=UPI0023DE1EE1|nr:hypothetical protein [Acidovorax sp. SUPP3434]GKT00355.1 hypothetical protein AVKW3434_13220 [Acidovorax sp. SUPP3434]